jgi:L-histidine N-alpha-methyltransferase
VNDELKRGLTSTPRRVPTALLYDELGSMLFEAITLLPEYGVTRAGFRVLTANADAVVQALEGPLELVELGPGSGRKALVLFDALAPRQKSLPFVAVDVSQAALDDCERTLQRLPQAVVTKVCALYLDGLRQAPRREGHRRVVLFLGSNLSNFSRVEARAFLAAIAQELRSGDALLLGVDLEKPREQLLPAYDDALGVTAAFNKNVLVRLNREWGADFDLPNFRHEARWNADERRVEMHQVAQRACTVRVTALDLTFDLKAGESLWTESSHRFSAQELKDWAREAGFEVQQQFIDEAWPFAQTLMVVP